MSEETIQPAATDTPVVTDAPATDVPVDGNQPAAEPVQQPVEEKKTLLGSEPPVDQPIEYGDFELPEDFDLNKDDAKILTELGQEFKMPQEAVQKLVNLGVQMQQRQIAEQQKAIASWADAARQDKDYGGEKLEQSLLTAQRAFSLPRGDKISKILFNSGLGNHPDVIGFMAEVGKLLEPDSMINGKGSNSRDVSPASVWYDKTT
ncbi:hypothetical protein [Acinetobacter puyangensis]|uniref:hypothetical protein n=1 Tax=Acinetobacter puyangensis TaxID=1096779 RepID=UPI003A4DC51F